MPESPAPSLLLPGAFCFGSAGRRPSPKLMHNFVLSVLRGFPWWLLLSTCLLMTTVAVFGFNSLDTTWINDAKASGESSLFSTDLIQILLRNVGAALVLYSGIVTFGLTTLIGAGVLSLYLGATVSLGLHSVGATGLISDVVWYVPFEFAGLAIAATAGIQPAAGLISRFGKPSETTIFRSFTRDVIGSLNTLMVALSLIVIGAAIEFVLIQTKI